MLDVGNIRRASINDLDDIVKIEQKCFQGNSAYSKRQLKYLLSKAKSICLTEINNNEICGYVIVLFRNRSNVAGVETLGVDPAFRGKGVGIRLLKAAEENVFSLGFKKIKLEVATGNIIALNLYQKLGFHPIKLLTNYYIFENNGTRNAYRMIKELT